ncbi:MAG: nucleoside hydrolase [Actinomycetota bacterium]|nr:nucleoside hydrolase [Actinomycetota bacterium]MEC9395048.1 nucleoside hydrolase [Actinomycetota bacterium]
MNRRSLVIDTDTASDDAVALLLAGRDPGVDIRLVTIVAGNVPVDYGTRNALVTLDLLGLSDVPVCVGATRPLVRPLETAQMVHGADGMGGADLPPPSRGPDSENAVAALLDVTASEPGQHALVTLGPLTNVAQALAEDPDLLTRFTHTYLMAGSPDGVGNVNPLGEYNVWADPEAATTVFDAPGPKTMIGWNISRTQAVMTPPETARLRDCGPLGEFAVAINADVERFCLQTSGLAGMDLPDPVAMAVALDDSIILESTVECLVIGLDEPTRGAVLPDRRAHPGPAKARVVWSVDEAAFKDRLYEACTGNPAAPQEFGES